MKIITHTCDCCGGIVAGNVLERYHRVECPGPGCDYVHLFDDLSEEEQEYLIEHSPEDLAE